ncbi:D-alanine--D-alanine ligase, partial [bacterium]|nr:D-alanine--D-alanine ligase [bacterium]
MDKKKRIRVLLLYGGMSTEHEVSLSSAIGILNHVDKSKYKLFPVKISKDGRCRLLPESQNINSEAVLEKVQGSEVIVGDPQKKGIFIVEKDSDGASTRVISFEPMDVVFPILHGTFGEDGTIQGLYSLMGLPCVGGGVLASAVSMDKIMMKQLFFQNDLQSADFIWFLRKKWEKKADEIIQGIRKEIGFPCFVKPANTGSSVGIFKVHKEEDLEAYVERAAEY